MSKEKDKKAVRTMLYGQVPQVAYRGGMDKETPEHQAVVAQLRLTMNARKRGKRVTEKEHQAIGDAARIAAEGSVTR